MKIYAKNKYPCGLVEEISIKGFFVSGNIGNPKECPLHGKDCSLKQRRVK